MTFSFSRSLLTTLLLACLLAGCQVELHSDLSEGEANEILGVLLKRDIPCEKVRGEEKSFTVTVEQSRLAEAVDLLKANGYPREKFASLGQVFKKEGLVSSPMEERVRFIYALSQELSQTISEIDGVLAARVHIVLPENNPLSEKVLPSSASVFIKYKSDANIEASQAQIKKLVVNSIEGLSYDKVAVTLSQAQTVADDAGKPYRNLLFLRVAPDSWPATLAVTGGLGLLALGGLGAAGFMFWRSRRKTEADHG